MIPDKSSIVLSAWAVNCRHEVKILHLFLNLSARTCLPGIHISRLITHISKRCVAFISETKFTMKMIRQLSKTAVPQWKGTIFRSMSSTSYPHINTFRTHTPEDGFVLNSIYEPISLPDLTVDQYVWKNISKWQNKVAIVSSSLIFFINSFRKPINSKQLGLWSDWSQIHLLETTRP